MVQKATGLSPASILKEFKKNNITHLVWLPDSETNFLYEAMSVEPSLDIVPVAREGESIAIAAGLILGGKRPIVLIQSTGLYESGDSIRGMGLNLNLPLVVMIGYRGWTRHGLTTDSAARYLEHILHAWGINYYVMESDAGVHLISHALAEAQRISKPVALLVGQEYG